MEFGWCEIFCFGGTKRVTTRRRLCGAPAQAMKAVRPEFAVSDIILPPGRSNADMMER